MLISNNDITNCKEPKNNCEQCKVKWLKSQNKKYISACYEIYLFVNHNKPFSNKHTIYNPEEQLCNPKKT